MVKKRNKASSTPRERLYIYLTKTQKQRLTEYTSSLGLSNSKYVTKLIIKEVNKQIQLDQVDDNPNSILNDTTLLQVAGGRKLSEEERTQYLSVEQLAVYNEFMSLAAIQRKKSKKEEDLKDEN